MKRDYSLGVIVRNAVFGIEDGLVSTVGFLAGIASANVPRQTLFLSGFVLIVVESLSMGVGSVLSEATVEELKVKRANRREMAVGGAAMFVSYFVSGLIPLSPYLFVSGAAAFGISIFVSLFALCLLGYVGGKLGKGSSWRSVVRMLLLGGLAVAAGVAVGRGLRMS